MKEPDLLGLRFFGLVVILGTLMYSCAPKVIESPTVSVHKGWWCASMTDSTKFCWVDGYDFANVDTFSIDPTEYHQSTWRTPLVDDTNYVQKRAKWTRL